MDCGATCLRMIAKFYGQEFPSEYIRNNCYISREGVSLLGISDAAEKIGFRTIGAKLTEDQFRDEITFPCIVHWDQNHFIVVYKIKKHRKKRLVIYVADPAVGLLKYDIDSFLQQWQSSTDKNGDKVGIVLLLEPTPGFTNISKFARKENDGLNLKYILQYAYPYKKQIVLLFLSLIIGSLLNLLFPFLMQAVVDKGIGQNNLNLVVIILIAQVALTIGQMVNNFTRSWIMLHMTTKMGISLVSDFLNKLMRLPIAFFDAKMVGDIMQRIGDHNRIQSFLTGSLISVTVAALTFIVYSCIAGGYDLSILIVFLLGGGLYIFWILLFLKRRKKLDHLRFKEMSTNQNNIVQLVSGMQDIKLNNCEKQKRWMWENTQKRLYKISIKNLSLEQTQEIGGVFIDQIKNVLISFLAAKMVISGQLTLGMMMALQYIIGQLNAPLSQFIGFITSAQDAKISLERLNEIHAKEDEEPADQEKIKDIPVNKDLILEDIVFQYEGPHSEKVLDDVSLRIETGKVTAIVGTSGSGKTTLLKLLLGFYSPIKGTISLGDVSLSQYSEKVWRSHCCVVMQESFIFSDTISNNIGIIDESPDIYRVKKAAKIANINDFIESLPLAYGTKIGVDGHGLSTGQKQRLLIARAAYKDAKYIMLDEATNSLDASNEKIIMERLKTFFEGKTVVIIAHRLSTVKNADKVIVLNKGKVVEQGSHTELIIKNGYYYNLVKDQLELGN